MDDHGWQVLNSLNAELNPIRHLLALTGAHHFVHVSRVRVNRGQLMSIWCPIGWLLSISNCIQKEELTYCITM